MLTSRPVSTTIFLGVAAALACAVGPTRTTDRANPDINTNKVPNYTVSWIAGTYFGPGDENGPETGPTPYKWVPDFAGDIVAGPNNRIYAAGGSEAWGSAVYEYVPGTGSVDMIGRMNQPGFGEWKSIAIGQKVYMCGDGAAFENDVSIPSIGIFPLNPRPLTESTQPEQVIQRWQKIDGLAVRDNILYVASTSRRAILLLDENNNYNEIGSWSVNDVAADGRLGEMVFDSSGNLWIIIKENATAGTKIISFTSSGDRRAEFIDNAIEAQGLAMDGNRLAVAVHPDNHVRTYDISFSPYWADTWGQSVFTNPVGQMGPGRFGRPLGIAFANNMRFIAHEPLRGAGNVSLSGNQLEGYSGSSRMWEVNNLAFVNGAVVDPDNANIIWSGFNRFSVDYSRPPGQEAVADWVTHDTSVYVDDNRAFEGWCVPYRVLTLDNQKFMFAGAQTTRGFDIYKLQNNVFVPSAIFNPGLNDYNPGFPLLDQVRGPE